MKTLFAALLLVILVPALSWAECLVNTGSTTYPNGLMLHASECDSSGALKTTGAGGGGGGASTIADGADVTTGAIADAAVTTNTTGTISGKLRGVLKLLIDMIAKLPALGTAGSSSTDVISVQGIASGTALPVSVASVPSHAVTNAGTFATQADTELPATAALADATANPTTTGIASYNMCFNGTTWDRCVKADAGAGNVSSSTQRVVLANNSIPCTSFIPVSQADDATVITGTASQYIYICSIVLVGAASEVINIIEGTGTVCATGTTVIAGSSTQANGMSFAANGGFSAVSALPFMRTSTLADNLCITQSGTSRVSGWISYTKAP